jgi:Xaa-Pro aminopeptidase
VLGVRIRLGIAIAAWLCVLGAQQCLASAYAARRAALIERAPGAAIVLQTDNAYWAEDLRYLTGVKAQGVIAVIEEATGKAVLFAPKDRIDEVRGQTDTPDVLPIDECESHLAALSGAAKDRTVYLERGPRGPEGVVGEIVARLREGHPDLVVRDISLHTGVMRSIKDEGEVRKIRIACEITAWALEDGIRSVTPGLNEGKVADVIRSEMLDLGAERADFWITGSGPNSVILHYMDNNRDMQDGDLVVLDWGAVYQGYLSDVTRTVPVNGRFTRRQRQVYEAVLRAQEKAISMVRPGVKYEALVTAVNEVLKEEGFEGKMGHGLGHHVGLDVHDVGPLIGVEMKPGMVFTIEPGIYLADEGLGVRIEDTLLVTEDGCEVLSRFVPKSVDEIEALVGRAAKQ